MVQHVAVSLRDESAGRVQGTPPFPASSRAFLKPCNEDILAASARQAAKAIKGSVIRPSQWQREQNAPQSAVRQLVATLRPLQQTHPEVTLKPLGKSSSQGVLPTRIGNERQDSLQALRRRAAQDRPHSSPTRRHHDPTLCRPTFLRGALALNVPESPTPPLSDAVPVPHTMERSPYIPPSPRTPAPRPSSGQLATQRTQKSRPPSARPLTGHIRVTERENSRPPSALVSNEKARPNMQGVWAPAAPLAIAESDSSMLYRRERVIGKGAFGSVSLVSSLLTGELAAMKTIDRTKLCTPNLKKTVEHEIKILKRLRHSGVVRLLEVIERPRSIHLVLEYAAGGNLQQLVKAKSRIDEGQARPFLWQLLDSVDYCHSQRVCHRDLKLENFVLDKQHRNVKLIDFGLSVVWRPDQALFKSYGTPCYTAPEILSGQSYRGPQVDVWSLGVSLYAMLTGSLPFQAACSSELKRRVLSGRLLLPDFLSAESRDLIRQMLTLSPEHRIDIACIRKHSWLRAVALERAPASPTSRNEAESEALDAKTIRRLADLGLDGSVVAESVRSRAYNHEAACYELLRAASMR